MVSFRKGYLNFASAIFASAFFVFDITGQANC